MVTEDVGEEELDQFCEQNLSSVEVVYFEAHAKMQSKLEKEKLIEGPDNTKQPINVQVQMPVQQNDLKNTWGEFDGTVTKWTGFATDYVQPYTIMTK